MSGLTDFLFKIKIDFGELKHEAILFIADKLFSKNVLRQAV